MCVVLIADKLPLEEEHVESSFHSNDHGAGVAWREGGRVHWKKGIMELGEVQDLIKKLPLPYVAHFRIASVGGKSKALCHPFTIDKDASVEPEGSTKGEVLFHNGHWGEWRRELKEAASHFKIRLPRGKWSDTRAMAFVTHAYGDGYLDLIEGEKVCVFGPDRIQIFGTWQWDPEAKIWASNGAYKSSYKNWTKVTDRRPPVDPQNPGMTGTTGAGSSKHGYHTTPPASLPGFQRADGGGVNRSFPAEKPTNITLPGRSGGASRQSTFRTAGQVEEGTEGDGAGGEGTERVRSAGSSAVREEEIQQDQERLPEGTAALQPGVSEGGGGNVDRADEDASLRSFRMAASINSKKYRTRSFIKIEHPEDDQETNQHYDDQGTINMDVVDPFVQDDERNLRRLRAQNGIIHLGRL